MQTIHYNESDDIGVPLPKGDIRMEFTDAATGEVLDVYEEHNIVVYQARECIIARLFENRNSYRVRFCKIGNDVGVGTDNDPEEPTRETTLGDMNIIYELSELQSVNYGADGLNLSYNIFINGQNVMQEYPAEESIGFTSIGLFTQNGLTFSYRRFPVRTITENININIIWTIYYEDE